MLDSTKQCPYCAETIKAEAVVCRFCGKSLTGESLTPLPTKKRGGMMRWLIIGLGAFVVVCCGIGLLSAIASSGAGSNSTRGAAAATDVTPVSTRTTAPRPTAPPAAEIIETVSGMTDAQRNAYNESLKGSVVEGWRGVVSDVDEGEILGGFTVWVDMDESNFASEVYIDVTEDVALTIQKDSTIVFSGEIDFVSDTLGVGIHIKNATIEMVEE